MRYELLLWCYHHGKLIFNYHLCVGILKKYVFSDLSCILRFASVEMMCFFYKHLVWLEDYVNGFDIPSTFSKSVRRYLLRSRFLANACCWRICLTFIIKTITATHMMRITAHVAHITPSPEIWKIHKVLELV